jgi:hypothetical protein
VFFLHGHSSRPCPKFSVCENDPPRLTKLPTRRRVQAASYAGTTPLTKLPSCFADEPDLRGGVVCRFRSGADLPAFTFHSLGKRPNSWGDIGIRKNPVRRSCERSKDRIGVWCRLYRNSKTTCSSQLTPTSMDGKAEQITVNSHELRNGKMELVRCETDPWPCSIRIQTRLGTLCALCAGARQDI